MRTLPIPVSKSMANRSLILSSFLTGEGGLSFSTQARDVLDLQGCLAELKSGQTHFSIKEGGTTFRFFLARLSRESGRFSIQVSKRLFERPHEVLYSCLSKLGVVIELDPVNFKISLESSGWIVPTEPLVVDCEKSTQFASALLLSSAGLKRNIIFRFENLKGSLPYFKMTVRQLEQVGLKLKEDKKLYVLAGGQNISGYSDVEIDISSAFSVAVVAGLKGDIFIPKFPRQSLQADFVFVDILKKMGVDIHLKEKGLCVGQIKLNELKPVDINIEHSPDLFPVLSILCGLVNGTSFITGLESLAFKESDRLSRSIELLLKAGVDCLREGKGVRIFGRGQPRPNLSGFSFNPDHDHRMAMAAAVLKTQGLSVEIETPEVVNKSLPEFWELTEVSP